MHRTRVVALLLAAVPVVPTIPAARPPAPPPAPYAPPPGTATDWASWTPLERLQARVTETLTAVGADWSSTGVDPEANVVVVGVPTDVAATRLFLRARFGAAPIRVEYEPRSVLQALRVVARP